MLEKLGDDLRKLSSREEDTIHISENANLGINMNSFKTKTQKMWSCETITRHFQDNENL